MFKRDLLDLVLSGAKTQTRRRHKRLLKERKVYSLKRGWFSDTGAKIRILRVFRQRLGEVSEEEARKEGFASLEEFREKWISINGSWNSEEEVVAYEFVLVKKIQRRLDSDE